MASTIAIGNETNYALNGPLCGCLGMWSISGGIPKRIIYPIRQIYSLVLSISPDTLDGGGGCLALVA